MQNDRWPFMAFAQIRRLLKGVLRRHLRARVRRAEEQCGTHKQYSAG
jgi:hypothetical protein